MRLKKSKFFFFFSLILLMGMGFFPTTIRADPLDSNGEYIIANDLIKNFRIESFAGEPVSLSGVSKDGKLMFEDQAIWTINKEDISLVDIYTIDDNAYLRYRVGARNKINMFTTLNLYQCAEDNQLNQVTDTFKIAKYWHDAVLDWNDIRWEAFVEWDHYDFGNIKQWNDEHNTFEGDVVMSFDIAQGLLPNFMTTSGDTLAKNFDYIAVSSAGVMSNKIGKLSEITPNITAIAPSEDDTGTRNKAVSNEVPAGPFHQTPVEVDWDVTNPQLYVYPDPVSSSPGSILPQTPGSNLHPTTKSGNPVWNPELEQKSMTDCKLTYHITSLSPLVTEYQATLSFTYLEVKTKTNILFQTYLAHASPLDYEYTEPIALHVTNRYIQTEIMVVFDIFCSYNIDVGADGIEDFDLEFPEEYYDILLWLTTVDGFGGGKTYIRGPDPMGFIFLIIIIIIIALITTFVVIKIVIPYFSRRVKRK